MVSPARPLSISIALATHNGAAYVREQIRSILCQTRLPRQIVVSDDNSTDDTLEIVRAEVEAANAKLTTPIELVEFRNSPALGVTANFAQAIEACTSDLVALSDQDDVWMPDKLDRMAREFEHRPDLTLLHSDLELVDGAGTSLGTTLFRAYRVSRWEKEAIHESRAVDVLLRRNLVTGASTMFRRSLSQLAAPFPPAWVHDEWLAMVAATTGRVDCLDEPLVLYRQHGANQIGASKMTLRHYIGRMVFPRTQRNERLLTRAREFAQHPSVSRHPAMRAIALEKLAHERARSAYPASRWRRIGPIRREHHTGRYRRFGLGLQDIARDLIQPV